jgi:hypothetical protein
VFGVQAAEVTGGTRGWEGIMTRLPPQGNGSGKFEIGAHDMGGWVRVIAGATCPKTWGLTSG